MTHFVEICEFGKIHAQCRCASRNKVERHIVCSMPDKHRPTDEYQPKHRRDE